MHDKRFRGQFGNAAEVTVVIRQEDGYHVTLLALQVSSGRDEDSKARHPCRLVYGRL